MSSEENYERAARLQHVGPQGAVGTARASDPPTARGTPKSGGSLLRRLNLPSDTPTFKTCTWVGKPAGVVGARPAATSDQDRGVAPPGLVRSAPCPPPLLLCPFPRPPPGPAQTPPCEAAWVSHEGGPLAYFGVTSAAQGSPRGTGLTQTLSVPKAQEGLATCCWLGGQTGGVVRKAGSPRPGLSSGASLLPPGAEFHGQWEEPMLGPPGVSPAGPRLDFSPLRPSADNPVKPSGPSDLRKLGE